MLCNSNQTRDKIPSCGCFAAACSSSSAAPRHRYLSGNAGIEKIIDLSGCRMGRKQVQKLHGSKHVNAWSLSRTSLKHGTCSDLLSLLIATSGKAEQAFDAPQSGALKAAENAAKGILFHRL